MSLSATMRLTRPAFELDVDITDDAHRVIGLLGPNGSGKSTTLRCLAGLETPSAGRIEIAERTVFSDQVDLPPEQIGRAHV